MINKKEAAKKPSLFRFPLAKKEDILYTLYVKA